MRKCICIKKAKLASETICYCIAPVGVVSKDQPPKLQKQSQCESSKNCSGKVPDEATQKGKSAPQTSM